MEKLTVLKQRLDWVKVPFLDSEQTLPKEILLYDMAASDVITKDKKTMIADSYVLWQISDPILFSKTLNRSVTLKAVLMLLHLTQQKMQSAP